MRLSAVLSACLMMCSVAASAQRSHAPRHLFAKAFEKVDTSSLLKGERCPYPDYSDRTGWDEYFSDKKEAVIKAGEKYLDYQWEIIKATDYLAFERTGDRNAMQDPNVHNLAALTSLALAELAEGKGRFMDQIINGVWFECERTSWVYSAHQYRQKTGRALPDYRDIFLDLATQTMGLEIAADLYFFGREWDKIDPCISATVAHALDVQVFRPYLDPDKWKSQSWLGFTQEGEDTPYFWENWDPRNNWNIWCNVNVARIFAFACRDRKTLMAGLKQAVVSSDNYLDYVDMDGGCDEGPAYWGHATGCLYEFIAFMNEISDGKFGCWDDPQYIARTHYLSRMNLSDGWEANFSDGTATSVGSLRLVYSMGRVGNNSEMMDYAMYLAALKDYTTLLPARGSICDFLDAIRLDASFVADYSAALAKAGGDPAKLMKMSRLAIPAGTWYPGTQHFVYKSKNGMQYVAKAGHNEESHNHNDVGTLILFDSGMPILVDAGSTTYKRQTFNKKERYTIWSMRSEWHNLPLMNGCPQHDGRQYSASWAKADASKGTFSAEISGAYEKEALCRSLVRTCSLAGRTLAITDKFDLEKRVAADEEHFLVRGDVKLLPGGKIRITYYNRDRSKSGTATLFYSSNLTASVETKVLDDPRQYKVWGKELRRIILKSSDDAPAKGVYKIRISAD